MYKTEKSGMLAKIAAAQAPAVRRPLRIARASHGDRRRLGLVPLGLEPALEPDVTRASIAGAVFGLTDVYPAPPDS
jgi:hypothetical protein